MRFKEWGIASPGEWDEIFSMKIPFPNSLWAWAAAVCAVATVGFSARAGAQVLSETRFNDTAGVTLENGAALGGDGSGVSGKPSDKSYSAVKPAAGGEAPGEASASGSPSGLPVAILTSGPEIPKENLEALTVTAWYKPEGEIPNDATLFSAYGTAILWDQARGQWVWRILGVTGAGGEKVNHWFASGSKQEIGKPGEWHFLAMTWTRATKSAQFYAGGVDTPVAALRDENKRPEDVTALSERAKDQRAIGNNPMRTERAFLGNIDDVRFYGKALDAAAIEKIRAADVANQAVSP
jgi:hypothetical protein